MRALNSWTATVWSILLASIAMATHAASSTTIHGSWSVECREPGRHCVATQKVATDPAGEKVVLGVMVEPGKDGSGPLLTFRMTSKAYKGAGAGMKIDQHEPLRAPISSCDGNICEVRARLTPELSTRMSKGKLLVFAFFLDSKQQVTFPVSLNGFAAAFAQVTASSKPLR